MDKNIKVSSLKARNMDKEFIHGKMETDMKDSLLMIKEKVWENTTGMMEDFTKENGKQTE